MPRRELRQFRREIMPGRIMGQVDQADGAMVLVTQRLPQHAPERRQAGAGGHQQQRTVLPFQVVAQGAAAQFAEAHLVAYLQAAGKVAEGAGLATIEVEFQPGLLARQAGQRIGPRHAAGTPQDQVLAGAIAQRALRLQAQTEDIHSRPVDSGHRRRQAVAQRVERLDGQVFDHPALAGQPPTVRAARRVQRFRPVVEHVAAAAAHQAGMATAGPAAVGHGNARAEQGVQQVGSGRHRPALRSGLKFWHAFSPRFHRFGHGRASIHRLARRTAGDCRPMSDHCRVCQRGGGGILLRLFAPGPEPARRDPSALLA
ncbi:hypothetical protein D3C78_1054310 [compost metagenome]